MDDHAGTQALIDSIYEAGMDGTRWPALVDKLGRKLNAGFGNLWLLDKTSWSFNYQDSDTVSAFSGLDSSTVDCYKEQYARLNVWLPNALDLPEGALTLSSALYPDNRLKGTEFYDVFLRPNDLFYALGSSVVKRGSTDVRMSFVRSERAGRYSRREQRLVQQLMPHLRNAVVLHRELYRTRALGASGLMALELVPMGVILLTHDGRLLHANGRAHDLMAHTNALRIGPAGVLLAGTAGHLLQKLIHEAVATGAGKGNGHGGALRLAGPAGRRLQLLVTPLPMSAGFAGSAPAAIFCSDPDAVAGAFSQRLEAMYRMTTAEAQLTEALVNGQSLQQYAQARCVTLNTLRTQLKSATAKAGAKRQADLVRIVLTGPALFGRRD
jgi:DNA-binding CsgD family transcriptional regulator